MSSVHPSRRRTHVPNRLGGLRRCSLLASASWASLNQIALGTRALQNRAIPRAYVRASALIMHPGG